MLVQLPRHECEIQIGTYLAQLSAALFRLLRLDAF